MHIVGIRKFCCIYQIVKEVGFFQLKRSYNPFKAILNCLRILRVFPRGLSLFTTAIASENKPGRVIPRPPCIMKSKVMVLYTFSHHQLIDQDFPILYLSTQTVSQVPTGVVMNCDTFHRDDAKSSQPHETTQIV